MNSKITVKAKRQCDVFVIGAGIAGIMAAISAAEKGANVIIASSSKMFSGSSFYPGTWGLGLIGPVDKSDEDDLINTIKTVGCEVIDYELVKTFVSKINPTLEKIKEMGIKLKQPNNSKEKEFIPCFDHKERNWNGILFDSAKEVFSKKIDELKITRYEFSEVIEIVKDKSSIEGVILIKEGKEIEYIRCKAIVIASGGIGGLFKQRLNTDDVNGLGQSLALKIGCQLVNIEFMQMMPGYINPCPKTIFNEKTFKYVEILDYDGKNILEDIDNYEEKLKIRSTHGPFTSRLVSKDIDYAIFKEGIKEPTGVRVVYKDSIKKNQPEFIRVYFEWLKEKKHLTVDDEINIGIFFHAANGGIKINKCAETDISGVFAAGEVTGGMHGADRIGGLSTANGLVFGKIAGESASKYAQRFNCLDGDEIELSINQVENAEELLIDLQNLMFKYAMIEKSEEGIVEAINLLEDIKSRKFISNNIDIKTLYKTYRLNANLLLAEGILRVLYLRKESRGSHYRKDYPRIDEKMSKKILVRYRGKFEVDFE
ncbi:FAD-binding protein [Clostridium sp. NSJ-6]|uniref:L-aspartate oxidase n=1 Tax=Clostridium hominis TaxID=2763036 RepID=A0ABR7DHQ7_9CLOT|nr:FAD-binding protein [Clostridium hominis]MBC5630378.1 FAD-binding protein [Clostridium hominis]MDU2670905.1 FAD-binding protein [Clostridium sp.]